MTRRPSGRAPRGGRGASPSGRGPRPVPRAQERDPGSVRQLSSRPVRGTGRRVAGGTGTVPAGTAAPTGPRPDPGRALSEATARRFTAHARARRLRRLGVLAAVGVLLGATAWLLLDSPWLRARHVDVRGAYRLEEEVVVGIARAEVGRPLLMAGTDGVERRLREFPVVRDVRVSRAWPSTIRVEVRERVPVAALPSGREFHLVDGSGVVMERRRRPPRGVPVLRVELDVGGVPALSAASTVAREMSTALRPLVRDIGAEGADRVWLTLRDGSRVVWGSGEDSRFKSEVLLSLRTAHGSGAGSRTRRAVYDVSAPHAPAVRGVARRETHSSRGIRRHALSVVESTSADPYRPDITRLT